MPVYRKSIQVKSYDTYQSAQPYTKKLKCFKHPAHIEVHIIRYQGRPQDLGGGGQEISFSDLGIWEFFAKPCAMLGGFGGMLPRENFLKRCNLVRIRVYFGQILSLFFSKNAIFYIKNKYFRYTFVMGYFS